MMSFRFMIAWLQGFKARVVILGPTALIACSAVAQMAGPAPAVTGTTPVSRELGTLILSPAQRRNLESARNAAGNVDSGMQVLSKHQSEEAATGLPDALAISGIVVRSGNRSTVWVNEQPLYGRAAANPLRTLAGQAGVLQQGKQDMVIKAKPGQVIDVPSGTAVDLLPPGAIRIIPPKATVNGTAIKKE